MNVPSTTLKDQFEDRQETVDLLADPPRIRRAFVSAPDSLDISMIREALTERGITPYGIEDDFGGSIPEILKDCLVQADLVIVAMGSGGHNDNVYFELGFAVAMQKRILVLAPRDEISSFYSMPYLRIDPSDKESIGFGLDQILNAPEGKFRVGRSLHQTRPIGKLADELLGQIRSRGQISERETLTILNDVLRASGIESTSVSSEHRHEPGIKMDMAVWSDDFDPWIGNPLLIEVKQLVADSAALTKEVGRMGATLAKTGTEWGLLICQLGDFHPGEELKKSRVLLMTVEDLLESLRDQSLGDILRKLRNRRVHGKG